MNLPSIRIEGPQAVEIAATVRHLNPGFAWREIAFAPGDSAGCKIHARRVEGRTQYEIQHRATYGCAWRNAIQPVTVVPVIREDVEPAEARMVLARAEKMLRPMVARGADHAAVLTMFGVWERRHAAALDRAAHATDDLTALVEAVAS